MSTRFTFTPSISVKQIEEKTDLKIYEVPNQGSNDIFISDSEGNIGSAEIEGDDLYAIKFYGSRKTINILEGINNNFKVEIYWDVDRYTSPINIQEKW